jgi:hypothetical protein
MAVTWWQLAIALLAMFLLGRFTASFFGAPARCETCDKEKQYRY